MTKDYIKFDIEIFPIHSLIKIKKIIQYFMYQYKYIKCEMNDEHEKQDLRVEKVVPL